MFSFDVVMYDFPISLVAPKQFSFFDTTLSFLFCVTVVFLGFIIYSLILFLQFPFTDVGLGQKFEDFV
jgi:hypothetical protein